MAKRKAQKSKDARQYSPKSLVKEKKKARKSKAVRSYSPRTLAKCLQEVRQSKMSIRKAAQLYRIPKSTITDKLSGKSAPEFGRPGPDCVLGTQVEKKLAEYMIEQAEKGFPLTREGIRLTVIDLIETMLTPQQQKLLPFNSNGPGKGWMRSFFHRHPHLTEKTSEYLSKQRNEVTETYIRKWFQETERFLKKEGVYDILQDPSRVFNLDETAVWLNPRNGKFIGKRGHRSYRISESSNKENTTVMFNISASGDIVPPLYIYGYEQLPKRFEVIPDHSWFVRKTDNGWIDSPTFYDYISEDFYPWLQEQGITLPVIVFVDEHYSHMNLQLSRWCAEHGIHLLCLPPSTTHILQPLDKSVFTPLKTHWRRELISFARNEKRDIDQHEVPFLLQQIIENCNMKTSILNGFHSTGLYPFDADNVDYSLCLECPRHYSNDCDVVHNETLLQMVENYIPTEYLQKLREMKNRGMQPRSDRFTVFNLWSRISEDPLSSRILIPIISNDIPAAIVSTTENSEPETVEDLLQVFLPETEDRSESHDNRFLEPDNICDDFSQINNVLPRSLDGELQPVDKNIDEFLKQSLPSNPEINILPEDNALSFTNGNDLVIEVVENVSPVHFHPPSLDSFGILTVGENIEIETGSSPEHSYCKLRTFVVSDNGGHITNVNTTTAVQEVNSAERSIQHVLFPDVGTENDGNHIMNINTTTAVQEADSVEKSVQRTLLPDVGIERLLSNVQTFLNSTSKTLTMTEPKRKYTKKKYIPMVTSMESQETKEEEL